MRKLFTLLLGTLVSLNLLAQPSGYYDDATGTGFTLKTQLHNIITGQTSLSYSNLHTYFQTTDADNYYENDGSVLDMYSENPTGSDPYNYAFTSGDQCGNYGSEGDCYNREHSFPKSWFNDGYPMYADLFHLYPTDGYVNGQRSNLPFGEVGTASWTSQNGCKKGTSSYPGYTGTVFEPIDEFKGDFARSYFYMATCYEDRVSTWSSPMLDGSSDQVYEDWALNMLLEWHANDPVSQKEIDRNNAVYSIQGNRNPFIDNPSWANQIWGGDFVKPEPDNHLSSFLATSNSSSTVELTWTDANGINLPDGYVIKANTTGEFIDPVDGIDPTQDSDLSDGEALIKVAYGNEYYVFNELTAATTYFFKAWPYTNFEADIDFKLDGVAPGTDVTTGPESIPIFTDDFESDLSEWEVDNDTDPEAEAVISAEWSGAESTANALLFDAGNPADISYFTSSIEKTFNNSSNLSIDFWYYFEDYRGGEIVIYVNDLQVYSIATEGGGDIAITESDTDMWKNLFLNLSSNSSSTRDHTIKIEGISKCSSTWKDRVGIDQIKVYGIIDDNGVESDFGIKTQIYPNPATSVVNIVSIGNIDLELFDAQGKKVIESNIENEGTFSISHLNSGIYFLRLKSENKVDIRKLIVQ
jgi:endonuclease I